jgi:hypothetical protein
MLAKSPLALAAAVSLALGIASLVPATASAETKTGLMMINYSFCYENPSAPTCPGYSGPEQKNLTGNLTSHPYLHKVRGEEVPARHSHG